MTRLLPGPHPGFTDAARFWIRLGFISFGGPAGQIAVMHREIVERRAWLGEQQFAGALSFCMLLPGPEALQLAIYLGWKLHGVRGGMVAGLGARSGCNCGSRMWVLPLVAVTAALGSGSFWTRLRTCRWDRAPPCRRLRAIR